ncbi:hypothetical protein Tco_0974762 [Tanacetum coccineum]|uniref:Ribosomal protein S3 n=1 Tax=Tanacetum coccineum TaxID=301880 RepID=A0ABQ5ECG2_9ASTR
MMRVTTTFLRGEVAASNREWKKSFPSWKQQEAGHKQNFKKGGFRSQQRPERKHDRFTLLTKTPKKILALDKGKFKPPPPMTTPVKKRNASKFCEFHGENTSCQSDLSLFKHSSALLQLSFQVMKVFASNFEDRTDSDTYTDYDGMSLPMWTQKGKAKDTNRYNNLSTLAGLDHVGIQQNLVPTPLIIKLFAIVSEVSGVKNRFPSLLIRKISFFLGHEALVGKGCRQLIYLRIGHNILESKFIFIVGFQSSEEASLVTEKSLSVRWDSIVKSLGYEDNYHGRTIPTKADGDPNPIGTRSPSGHRKANAPHGSGLHSRWGNTPWGDNPNRAQIKARKRSYSVLLFTTPFFPKNGAFWPGRRRILLPGAALTLRNKGPEFRVDNLYTGKVHRVAEMGPYRLGGHQRRSPSESAEKVLQVRTEGQDRRKLYILFYLSARRRSTIVPPGKEKTSLGQRGGTGQKEGKNRGGTGKSQRKNIVAVQEDKSNGTQSASSANNRYAVQRGRGGERQVTHVNDPKKEILRKEGAKFKGHPTNGHSRKSKHLVGKRGYCEYIGRRAITTNECGPTAQLKLNKLVKGRQDQIGITPG